jgi:hypothetical protein
VTWDDEGIAMVYEKRRIKGTFLENMELNEFPFDYQVRSCIGHVDCSLITLFDTGSFCGYFV